MTEYLDNYIRGKSATYIVAQYDNYAVVRADGSFNFYIIKLSTQEVLDAKRFPGDLLPELSLKLLNKKDIEETTEQILNQQTFKWFARFIAEHLGIRIEPKDII